MPRVLELDQLILDCPLSTFVGIDGPKDKIIKWLMDPQGGISQRLRTMAIVGCGGLGKTTLANQVYLEIKNQFDCSAFVSLSQNPNMKSVLAKIISDVSGAICGALADEHHHLINKLREYLQDKRYFLVIDDIWDAQTWRIIECAFVKNSQGSRIVTTTRINDIAKSCCCSYGDQVYEMKALCATDSKRLFFRRIFNSDERCPPQLREAANDILRKCGGLPLAIVSISSLLATKPKSVDQWDMVKSRINDTQENSPDIETMTWPVDIEDDGQVHACRVHDTVLDFIVSRSNEENFVTIVGASNLTSTVTGKIRRLSFHKNSEGSVTMPAHLLRRHVRSLTTFSHAGQMPPLLGFYGLHVLDLENCSGLKNHDLKNIGRLIQLRYLNIKGTDISDLPCQIGELQYLEKLDIRSTHVKELPSAIVQLRRLAHLLVDCHVKLPDEIGNMQALEELTGFSVFMYPSTFLQEIGKISRLRVLRVVWNYVDFQGNAETYMKNLAISLTKLGTCYLQSLSLDIHGHEEDDFSLHLWSPAPCRLQKLYIGRWHPISRIPNWIGSLANLQYLHIYNKRIDQEDLRMLGSIPSLLTLYLFSDEAPEEKLTISSQGFQFLKFFKIHCYHMGLVFEAGSMAKLEYLHILISAFQVKSWDGNFDFGIQHLSCLTKVYAYINCYGLTAEEAEAAMNAIMVSVDTIPNHPKLQIDRRYAPL
uniref:Uncharacterized protein n=1 Tax=Oryza punctata TaxID=4537 RepID=A0A0E0LK72_ORYPU